MVFRRNTKESKKMRSKLSPDELSSLIQQRAYSFFEQRGYAHGDDWTDWLEAESQIKREYGIK